MVADEEDNLEQGKMFYLKVYEVSGEVLVAACDSDVLGKRFSEGKLQIHVNEGFYKGCLAEEGEVMAALNSATIANIVGNRIVERAIECSIVSAENVVEIGGVKHAQVVTLPRGK